MTVYHIAHVSFFPLDFIRWKEQRETKAIIRSQEVGEIIRDLIHEPPSPINLTGRTGGSEGTPQQGNSDIMAPEDFRRRAVGGGTVPTDSPYHRK